MLSEKVVTLFNQAIESDPRLARMLTSIIKGSAEGLLFFEHPDQCIGLAVACGYLIGKGLITEADFDDAILNREDINDKAN